MKRWSLGLIGVACWLSAGIACASAGGDPAALSKPGQTASAASRAATFAAASVPFAKRLTPEQREEWRFLKDTAAQSRFESDAARMALAKSADPEVRSLAATLVNFHTGLQPTLQRMLHVRNIAPPMLSNDQRVALNRLTKLQGAKFDREWMESVGLRSQQDGVQAFEKAAGSAHDPSLRSWIARTLPTMRSQLASAERVAIGETKYARLAPSVPQVAIKSASPPRPTVAMATRYMGAAPAAFPSDAGDLAEGNMLLGPAKPVAAVTATGPSTR
jgi:putative membrane protein